MLHAADSRPVLLIDNYDSFAHNLARYVVRLGHPVQVVRNDAVDLPALERSTPGAIILSPGPATPDQAGCCLPLVRRLWQKVPILGVCLGHQVIAQALGGSVVRARQPLHGQASDVYHDESPLYAGLPNPFQAGRYHSLVVQPESVPAELIVRAWTRDRTIMALEHVQRPVVGWQFHPESVLSDCGYALLARFLARAGLRADSGLPFRERDAEGVAPVAAGYRPVEYYTPGRTMR
jgi:anthranilate synthase/aminodeoxychorismate synthase-like glutamine amidotransferase